MNVRRWCLAIVWTLVLASAVSAGQEMVFQYSFPSEAMLAQDIYIKYGAGLACDRAGNVWVVDSGQGILQQFDPRGKFLKKVGRQGQGPEEFSRPGTIHVGNDGDLLVLDTGNMRMAILSSEGEFKRSFKILSRYEDFCVCQGKIYLVYGGPREDGKTVDVLSLDGEPLGSFGEAPDFGPVAPYNIRIPYFKVISCGPEGPLVVGWNFFPVVHILDPVRQEATAKIEIDDSKLKERSRNNLGEIKKDQGLVSWVVQRTRAHRGGFLASVPAEKIEILDCDLEGKVQATYWAPPPEEGYLGRDFVCREDGRTTWIYILQTRPESKVNVYRIEPQF
jgi:6-bladed beta-propeller